MKNQNNTIPTGLNYKQFYKELGHLLYAVSCSDGIVRRQEVEALREFVLKELAPFEPTSDSSGMNQAFYTQFEFDDLAEKQESATKVFSEFIKYLKKNASFINTHLKTAIIAAVEKVADAYKKTNKLEREMINNLKLEVNSL